MIKQTDGGKRGESAWMLTEAGGGDGERGNKEDGDGEMMME